MRTPSRSSRRAFIQTAVPLAAAAAVVPLRADGPARTSESADARLAQLEDLRAIRECNLEFARSRHLEPASFGEHDLVEIAPDRSSATALLHCVVNVEEPIGPDCPLLDMARQQGGGVVRRAERGVFEHVYLRRNGVWSIQESTYRREG